MNDEKVVALFRGTALATPERFAQTLRIITDTQPCVVVVSAPGEAGDMPNVTDVIYRLIEGDIKIGETLEDVYRSIVQRFVAIAQSLDLEYNPEPDLESLRPGNVLKIEWETAASLGLQCRAFELELKIDWETAVSLGEYVCAKLLASALEKFGYTFVDAEKVICVDNFGRIDMRRTISRRNELDAHIREGNKVVLPGNYGSGFGGDLRLIENRGGSDVTVAAVANMIGATECRIYSHGQELCVANRMIVPDAPVITDISRKELRELCYLMGKNTIHEQCLRPLEGTSVPVTFFDLQSPDTAHTTIVDDGSLVRRPRGFIVGIADKKDCTTVTVRKSHLNDELGVLASIAKIFGDHGLSIEYPPSGVDSITVVVASDIHNQDVQRITDALKLKFEGVTVTFEHSIFLVTVVGIPREEQTSAYIRLFTSLETHGIHSFRLPPQMHGSSVVFGVEKSQHERAVRAAYEAFFPQQ